MTKKHFTAAAAQIKSEPSEVMRANLAAFFMSVAIQFNPNFDKGRFLAACGL
jgi:hypothetical protein